MNANRIQGLGPPDSNKPIDRQAQKEAAQKVEKVREVDPDEQARQQQRFQQIMQSDEGVDETESVPLPSPFDLSGARQNGSSNLGADEVPNSSYSQPPTVSPSSSSDTMSDEDLPQSDQFWQHADLPGQPISKPRFQEKPAQKKETGKKEVKRSILGPPGKPEEKKTADKPTAPKKMAGKAPKEEEAPSTPPAPTGRYWTSDHEPSSTQHPSKSSDHKKRAREKSVFEPEEPFTPEEHTERKRAGVKPFHPTLKKAQRKEGEKTAGQHKKEGTPIIAPSLPELPAAVQPGAIAATQAAAAYLRPEIAPLFYQMIGSILVMSSPPGISRTEFLLNNPAFANSKFFGASVELIKYSTAPDSYNIRLSGSNEAVAAFNQNIPSLMAAFQTGHFSFRIGRIDAEYSTDRPVLRRKESGKDRNPDKHEK